MLPNLSYNITDELALLRLISDNRLPSLEKYRIIEKDVLNGSMINIQHLITRDTNSYINKIQALQLAIKYYKPDLVEQLVEKYEVDIHTYNDVALRFSVLYGHLEFVEYLIGKGVIVNACNNALLLSIKYNRLNIVELFIKRNTNIHTYDDEVSQFNAVYGHLKIIKYPFGKKIIINTAINYALLLSIIYGQLDIIIYLLGQGADIHIDNGVALMLSAENGHLTLVKYFSKTGIDNYMNLKYSLLLSIKNKYSDVAEYLTKYIKLRFIEY
jgi:ankyrin repeat protein